MIQRKRMVKKLRLALCYYGETKNYFKFILNSMKLIQFSSSKCKLTVMEMICWPSTRATGTNCGILCRSRSSKSLIRLSNSLGNAEKTSVVNLQYVYMLSNQPCPFSPSLSPFSFARKRYHGVSGMTSQTPHVVP